MTIVTAACRYWSVLPRYAVGISGALDYFYNVASLETPGYPPVGGEARLNKCGPWLPLSLQGLP